MEMHQHNQRSIEREAAMNSKAGLETTMLSPAACMRPGRTGAGVATAAGVRRRVVKKHIQQKYLLCGFAIHAFLATPAYIYGNVVETDKDFVLRIWPAIVYQATRELCRFITEQLESDDYHGRPRETARYRRQFLLATFVICGSLMVSGVFFSSAWVNITTTTQAIAIAFYGFFAGIGASLYVWKTHVILEAVRPRDDRFVRKTIHLCGEAFCQLFLPFVFTNLRMLYGPAQSIVLMSALLVNLIPLSLIITRHHEGAITKRISVIKAEANYVPPLHHQLGRYPTNAAFAEPLDVDGLPIELPRSWRNPIEHQHSAAALVAAAAADTHTNYILAADEAYVTFVNPNGVEIMEIIEEEDESTSVLFSSTATIENYGHTVHTSSSLNCANKSHSNGTLPQSNQSTTTVTSKMVRIKRFSADMTTQLRVNMLEKIVLPLRTALLTQQLYTTTMLLSTDIFSYVMCLTVLPGLAVTHHAIKIAEIPFLYSLLAFPWMCFSLMTPRFAISLHKHKTQWHTLGCIFKSLALICISFSTSKLLLSVSTALLGFGQAVTLFLQNLVFQKSMTRSRWMTIRFPLHFTNGLLILLWGGLGHWVVVNFSFQATVGLAGGLYSFSIIIWHVLAMC